MSRVHVVKAHEAQTYFENVAPAGKSWSSTDRMGYHGVEFRFDFPTHNRGSRYSLSVHDANSATREVQGGPVIQKVGGYFGAQASMIYAGPRMPTPEVVTLSAGDLVVLDGADIIIRVLDRGRWQEPGVEIVHAPPATEDYTEACEAFTAQCNARAR